MGKICYCLRLVKLGVILLNWNNGLATAAAARMACGWKSCNPAIFVIDNGSADNCRGALAAECPRANYTYNNLNLGFGGGNNVGIKRALAAGCDTIMLLNNDAVMREADVVQLGRTLAGDRKMGVVGPVLKETNGKGQAVWSVGGRDITCHIRTHRRVDGEGLRKLRGGGPIPTAYVPGTVFMARSYIFRNIGLFAEDYFFSGEAADFCEQVRRAGLAVLVDPQAEAVHEVDHGSSVRETLYRYYNLRNRFLFVRRHCSRRRFALVPYLTACGLAMIAVSAARLKFESARAAWLGLRDGLAGRFGNRNVAIIGI